MSAECVHFTKIRQMKIASCCSIYIAESSSPIQILMLLTTLAWIWMRYFGTYCMSVQRICMTFVRHIYFNTRSVLLQQSLDCVSVVIQIPNGQKHLNGMFCLNANGKISIQLDRLTLKTLGNYSSLIFSRFAIFYIIISNQIFKIYTMHLQCEFIKISIKVLPHVAMKTNKNCSQINTKLFHSSLDLPHENEDAPVVRSDEKNTMLLFCY